MLRPMGSHFHCTPLDSTKYCTLLCFLTSVPRLHSVPLIYKLLVSVQNTSKICLIQIMLLYLVTSLLSSDHTISVPAKNLLPLSLFIGILFLKYSGNVRMLTYACIKWTAYYWWLTKHNKTHMKTSYWLWLRCYVFYCSCLQTG